jgi:ubiquinone/menaquinone biosynthesis C-methylase UbiE
MISETVHAHHRPAAAMWGRGGSHYDDVSFAISDALAHAAQRLNARAGERLLDVATGTGWSARNVARAGAVVTGVDIAEELLNAARALSDHIRPEIDFRLGDAESLPFDDGAFDGVISTFGVMFAFDQSRAAAELGRVCRARGRVVLATWSPSSSVAQFSTLLRGTATRHHRRHRR